MCKAVEVESVCTIDGKLFQEKFLYLIEKSPQNKIWSVNLDRSRKF